MEKGFVETIVLLAPTDVVFDTVLLLPSTSVKVTLHVDQLLLCFFVSEECADLTIHPLCLTQLFILVVDMGATDGEADDCR